MTVPDDAAPTSAPRVAVLGAGPGGYAAAFHAADLGMAVTLVDPEEHPGGVCLYRGCIPSKALLHVASLLREAQRAADWGVAFDAPRIELDRLRAWKGEVVGKLTSGLAVLAKRRGVRHVRGRGSFLDAHRLRVTDESDEGEGGGEREIEFDYAIVATGSSALIPEALRLDSPKVMDSTAALELEAVPERLLVVGGGYIGLELGTVYAALGARVTVVEMTSSLLPGVDPDLVRPLAQRLEHECDAVLLDTRVAHLRETADGVAATLAGPAGEQEREFERVLVAVGRRPAAGELGLERTRAQLDTQGFVVTDEQRRSAEPSLFAIGDVAGEPMLAHKAAHEARVAVETIAGRPAAFDPLAIPAVVFTDPEIAWCGLTEPEALMRGIECEVVRFPWSASGRAATLGRSEGITKLILEPRSQRVLGVGIAGAGAGELIAEGALAVELGARADDLRLTIHAHPTLSETLMEGAQLFFGPAVHYAGRGRPERGTLAG